jgi:transcriptional regulator with PAS, ATPase and Fis domain
MKLKEIDVDWAEEFNGSITVCDLQGIIVYMNRFSIQQFAKYGGEKLLGSNLIDCHPEPSKTMLKKMLKTPMQNMYTTESDGVKKIIYQTPWKNNDQFMGVIELSFQLEPGMPNFIRK